MRTPIPRLRSDGSITYLVQFRYGASKKDPTKKRLCGESFDDEAEALEFARRLDILGPQEALEWLNGSAKKEAVPTLSEVAYEHLRLLEGASPGHRAKERKNWDRTWGPRIGNFPADAITRDHLREALQDLADNGRGVGLGYSIKSLGNYRGLLHGVLTRCVERGYLDSHPGQKLKVPKGKYVTQADADDYEDDDDGEKVFLSLDEFDILHSEVSEGHRALVHFLVHTGCRWGEATALQVRDVSLIGSPYVRIRRAWKQAGEDGKLVLGPPKTKKSRRMVTINADVANNLAKLIEGKAPADWVFTAPRGGILRHRTFWGQQWRPALFRAQVCAAHRLDGCKCHTTTPARCKIHHKLNQQAPCGCPGTLGPKPRIHDLRHTQASWLLAAGYGLDVVRDRLGHESITTTVNIYGHLEASVREAAANAGMHGAREKEVAGMPTYGDIIKALVESGASAVQIADVARMLTQPDGVVDVEAVELAELPQ